MSTNLFDGHDNLNGVQGVKSEIVVEVGGWGELYLVSIRAGELHIVCDGTFDGSVTWGQRLALVLQTKGA